MEVTMGSIAMEEFLKEFGATLRVYIKPNQISISLSHLAGLVLLTPDETLSFAGSLQLGNGLLSGS